MSVDSIENVTSPVGDVLAEFEALWGDDWSAGMKRLIKQQGKSASTERCDMTWGVDDPARCEQLQAIAKGKNLESLAKAWLKDSQGVADLSSGLLAAAWSHALLAASQKLKEALWRKLFARLLAIAEDSAALSIESDPLAFLLVRGELSFSLGVVWSADALLKQGREALNQAGRELLDGNGFPSWSELPQARLMLAAITRCQHLGAATSDGCLTGDAAIQFDWFIRQSIRFTDGNGKAALANGRGGEWNKALFQSTMQLSGDEEDERLAQLALRGGGWSNKKSSLPTASPSARSEWSHTAMLRSDWSRGALGLAVSYGDESALHTELFSRKQTIWSGACATQVQVNGKPLQPAGPWEEVCWFKDDEAVFLELQQHLTDGWTLQRQFLLCSKHAFLYTADAIIGAESAQIEIENRWPLHESVQPLVEEENHELFLNTNRREAIVLPLALPEWRTHLSPGDLVHENGELVYRFRTTGSAAYLPMFVELNAKRVLKPFTWRQLTVAEKLTILPHDQAVGFRAHVGKKQWLFYRSLAETANRTVLGQNFSSEFYAGTFRTDGSCDDLVQIE